MPTHQVVGFALLVAAASEIVVLIPMRARAKDERQRTMLTVAMLSSAVLLGGLGGMFLTGVIGAESA